MVDLAVLGGLSVFVGDDDVAGDFVFGLFSWGGDFGIGRIDRGIEFLGLLLHLPRGEGCGGGKGGVPHGRLGFGDAFDLPGVVDGDRGLHLRSEMGGDHQSRRLGEILQAGKGHRPLLLIGFGRKVGGGVFPVLEAEVQVDFLACG